MKKTKIICTVGPSTDNLQLLEKLMQAGMDLARFNFSHGTHEEHGKRLELVRQAAAHTGKVIATIADTKGPEIRLGIFAEGSVELVEGQEFALTTENIQGTSSLSYVNYEHLPEEVHVGDTILLSDGMLGLRVTALEPGLIHTVVVAGGVISSRKRVSCPGIELQLPFLSEQDKKDVLFAARNDMDYIAASFVQKADDILAIRKVLEDEGLNMGIIAKIENAAGVEHIKEIIDVADGVMVARGDLGVEIPAEEVPVVQKEIITLCNAAGKPVITATQMLESMCQSFRCTRAEASDVANSIYDGTDVIMLSGETASGKYPLEAVETMAKIAERTEHALDFDQIFERKGLNERVHFTEAISHATVQISHEIDADAILSITEFGNTARMIAKYRPLSKVIAMSTSPKSLRSMQLYWGVTPVLGPSASSTDALIDMALSRVLEQGIIKEGATVVITAGAPVGAPGSTNLIRVVNVGKILTKGTGIGKKSVIGRAFVAKSLDDFAGLQKGDILFCADLQEEIVPVAVQTAAAIVCEEGGLTSTAAIVAVTCGLPVVVGAAGAVELVSNGTTVTVDTVSGTVYEGEMSL